MLAFSSQYPIDKIVETHNGSFVVPAGGSSSTTINHSLGRKCFTEMIWSRDGTNFQDGGQPYSSATADTVALPAADTNSITIYGGTTEGTDQTINYVLLVIWPS